MTSESRAIVSETFKQRPREVAVMIGQNFVASLGTHQPAADLRPDIFPVWSSIFDVIVRKFGPNTLNAFRHSAQMQNTTPRVLIEKIDNIVIPLAFAILIALIGYTFYHGQRDLTAFAVYLACGVFGDALLCSSVSGVFARYQARVTWLFILADLLIAAAVVANRAKRNIADPGPGVGGATLSLVHKATFAEAAR